MRCCDRMNYSDIELRMTNDPTTQVLLPSPQVASAVRAYIVRDTCSADPHVNNFPATPFCTLTWYVAGTVFAGASACGSPLASAIVGGPITRPTQTYSASRVQAFTVVLYPDAFRKLTGVDPALLTDRFVTATAALPDWTDFFRRVAHAVDDSERLQCVEAQLLSAMSASHPASPVTPKEWFHRLAAGQDQKPVSQRHTERRIKGQTGQTLSTIRCTLRFEAALVRARELASQGNVDWSDLAAELGYSDQAHFCREFKRMSGATPSQLIEKHGDKEHFWIYRHWK